MATNARGQTTLAGAPVTRASIEGLLMGVNDIRPVADATARAQLVAGLTAVGFGPSQTRPLYVDRADALPHARLESTFDGTTWRTHYADIGKGVSHTAGGGGAIGTSWTQANSPAVIRLTAGTYLVAASAKLVLSTSTPTRLSGHLFTSAGAAVGASQEATTAVETAGGDNSRTLEWTRTVTVAVTTDVVIRVNTAATGGEQSMGTQHLNAVRIA